MKKSLSSMLMLLIAMTAFLVSCKSTKDYVYLKDLAPGVYPKEPTRHTILQPGDRLSISVLNDKQELTTPFNSRTGYYVSPESGEISQASASGAEITQGYLISSEGYIEYPVLGKLQVSGLTLREVSDLIKAKIIQEGRLKNPSVTVEILNFKVFIIGQNNNNTQSLSTRDGQLTLLQALARIDLSSSYRINNVKVIRELDGQRLVYEVDLQTKELYNSPAYYLQQNDMIYVEPRYRMRDEVNIALRYISVVTAVSSFATTMIYLFKK